MSAEVADGSAAVHSPWLAESVCDEHLLAELAADLGGGTPAEPQRQYSGVGQSAPQFAGMPHLGMLQSQGSLPQSLMYSMGLGLAEAQQALLAFGSAPDINGALPNSLTSATNGSYGANGLLQNQAQQPMLMFRPAFLPAAGAGPAPAKSHSPSTSSGAVQAGDEYTDLCDAQRGGTGRAVNKGALAQKRFRERQKEKMRANEAQVAELTRKLNEVELDRSRLASRARLLEQVVSLNLIHEAKLHTNREIMVREQEMLLEDLASFLLTMSAAAQAPHTGSSPNSPEHLQGTLLPLAHLQQQQQQQATGMLGLQHQQQMHGSADGQQMQQQDVLQQLLMQQQQQQQQQLTGAAPGVHSSPHSGQVAGLMQVIRGWTVQVMLEQVFPEYIKCLQQLLPHISGAGSPDYNSGSSNASAATAQQAVESMVLQRREMTDRLALFSHYYWAVWCYNKGELAAQGAAPPAPQLWTQVLHSLNLSKEQTDAIVAARTALLIALNRVAADWQRVLPTLALQLLQVPRAQWHTVAAVQAMVNNLAAEREAVVGFLHTLIDEVLTPLQEGQLEASSYPWCPDVWAIAGAAAAAQAAAANAAAPAEAAGTGRGKGGRKAAAAAVKAEPGAAGQGALNDDPLAALSMGTDVLQPLMPFMTAFQLLREPITAKGAGLRLKRALLLDPFRTVVPAAAYPQPTAAEVYNMSLLDAHCGTFQQVMLWDWLKTNLPSYLSILGMQSGTSAAGSGAAPAPYMAGGPTGLKHSMSLGDMGLMA